MSEATVDSKGFNRQLALPYDLRIDDFALAMQDVYDFFHDVNALLAHKGIGRFDDILRPAAMSGIISDMLTSSLARKSRALVENGYHNGHPDLVKRGVYPKDSVQSGTEGIEIKTTRKPSGAVDLHGAREQWMCVFVYAIDTTTEPSIDRTPTYFRAVYLSRVVVDDFRRNERSELGTRTATLHRAGLKRFHQNWLYKI